MNLPELTSVVNGVTNKVRPCKFQGLTLLGGVEGCFEKSF